MDSASYALLATLTPTPSPLALPKIIVYIHMFFRVFCNLRFAVCWMLFQLYAGMHAHSARVRARSDFRTITCYV